MVTRMSTYAVLIFALCALFSHRSNAQFRDESGLAAGASPTILTEANFFQALPARAAEQIPGLDEREKAVTPSHKSPYLAAMLSLALPGLGEYYVGDQIWRGIIFTALDAGLWYERYHFIARGDDSTAAFQAFSDANWSPQIYADSLNSLLSLAQRTYRITDATNISQINKAEDTLNILGFANFTHQLPEKGTQQYYEIISKYIQFRLGWRDYAGSGPEFSPDYERAAFMRANMNYQYQVADYFLYGLFLNRILSAIDAVLLAKDHNTPIHLEGQLHEQRYPDGTLGFVPTAHFSYKF